MKKLIVILFLLFSFFLPAQNVVINEVLYDPVGSDGGYEWIELYNNSDEGVNLALWRLVKAGSEFETVFFFDLFAFNYISPHSYFLIGEEFVPNCDLTETLAFQNGGSETDGIRLISPDTLYTDTVLYDSPNTNNLPDDLSNPGIYFAVDVVGGNTLARKHDGEDTDNSETDFFECEIPTPGSANIYPVDLAIYELEIAWNNDEYWLQTEIVNLSTENVDNYEATLEITINSATYGIFELPAIPASSSVPFACNLGTFTENYVIVECLLYYLYDNQLDNNFVITSILIDSSPIVLNEIFFKPQSTNQEWLELFNRSSCAYLVDNWRIIDASGGEISFSGFLGADDFLVVCQDTILMMQIYPNIDPNKIIQSDSWTSLNNTTETLVLQDGFAAVFDSVFYDGNNCPADYSLERVNPFEDENIEWLVCLDSLGTPSFHNSVLPIAKDLELEFVEIREENGEIYHKIKITNIGLENIISVDFTCFQWQMDENPAVEIYADEITIDDDLEIVFSTNLPDVGYYEFEYFVDSEEDLNEANNSDCSFWDCNGLPFVINEIMYAPQNEMPEWLEIKFNLGISDMTEFFLVVDEDTLQIDYPASETEFMLVTNSWSDIDTLQSVYSLENIPIICGLTSLSNNGEQLALLDECGNLIESFCFSPDWNDAMPGISIERVNSCLTATENNWGPSVSECTPGVENSIFVQVLPPKMKLSVDPNPFSPYRGEHTIFSFKLPEVISRMTLRIFDLKGRMLRKLVNQELQASTGNIVWDGKGDNGKNLPIGVYVVLMEAASYESEKVYKKKITVVIGK
ncbi:MAG: lamin tail domain-containing protein [Candidatus Cloacimonadales bacterium]|nr:lamin tail domain-containing protein [Candidatus Cloacimonadales bacterium]